MFLRRRQRLVSALRRSISTMPYRGTNLWLAVSFIDESEGSLQDGARPFASKYAFNAIN